MTSHFPLDSAAVAKTLSMALPFIQRHAGETVVIKMGGNAMGDADFLTDFATDVVLLKQCGLHPVVVHGGGPQIGSMMTKMALEPRFVDGLRYTDEATVEIVEMVLSGLINKRIAAAVTAQGGLAVGLSGKDAGLIKAEKLTIRKDPDSNMEKAVDLGLVGEPKQVNPAILNHLRQTDFIPIVAPVGGGDGGVTYNINGDTAAGAIAGAMKAARLLLLTDVAGVKGEDGEVIPELSAVEARRMIAKGVISGGMIPKVETALDALEGGVGAVVIIDGRQPHAVLLELFTEHGAGTLLRG